MRYDMHKVVIERARSGARESYRNIRSRTKSEDWPDKQGMRRPYADTKEFSDLLGPLKGFLISRVGRPWNGVYSEIRERISPRSTVQIHILGHIDHMVATRLIERDGKFIVQGPYWTHEMFPGDLYVNPRTGVLCRAPQRRRQKAAKPPIDIVVVAPERELHRIDGIWYWALFADVPAPSVDADGHMVASLAVDLISGKEISYPGRYRIGKRQANHADLKRHGLENRAVV